MGGSNCCGFNDYSCSYDTDFSDYGRRDGARPPVRDGVTICLHVQGGFGAGHWIVLSIRDVSAGVPDDGTRAWADDLSFATSAPAQTSSPARPCPTAAAKPKPTAKAAPTAKARPTATQAAYHSSLADPASQSPPAASGEELPPQQPALRSRSQRQCLARRDVSDGAGRIQSGRNHRADVASARLLPGTVRQWRRRE